jgi:putative transposase
VTKKGKNPAVQGRKGIDGSREMMNGVRRLQAFRYELMPTREQECNMRRFAGCARFVFNKALAIQKAELAQSGAKQSGYAALCRMLTAWRNDEQTPWLGDAPVHTSQQALRNLEAGWTRHFESLRKLKRGQITPDEVVGEPHFKIKYSSSDSFRFPDAKQVRVEHSNNRMFLPKLGWVRYRNSRAIQGEISNITISRSGTKWFASIQTEREVSPRVHCCASMVGIDLGIVRFATLFDGKQERIIESIGGLKRHKERLAKAQRRLERKRKFGKNWNKAKKKLNKIHRQITNIRRDFLHKATSSISQNHAIVVVEDLKVRNMSKSASGTKENPGRRVKQKSGLNRSILDQGWGEFRRQLEYKQNWQGGSVIVVPAQNTSQTCPACGHVSAQNRRTRGKFKCIACGYQAGADFVAARNILAAGHAVLACEVNGVVMPSAAGTHREEAPCAA